MPKKILLADDSITIQKVVELTFSDGDYEVIATNNGAKAIQKLGEVRPDIILSDIIMPEKNGYEVCEFVKSHPDYRTIPVILLTGTFEPFDPDRAEKAGCDAVVTKPFESQSLIQKVEELISQNQAAPAAPQPEEAPSSIFETATVPPVSAPEPEPEPSWSTPNLELAAPPPEPEASPFAGGADESPFAPGGSFSSSPSTSLDEPPAGVSASDSPFEEPRVAAPAEHGSEIFGGPTQPSAAADMPFEEPPPPLEYSGETRAFPAVSFEDLQRMAKETAPPEPEPEPPAAESKPPEMEFAPPPPPVAAESPFEEPAAFSGETRAFPSVSFEDLQRMAAETAPPPAEPAIPPPAATAPETRAFPNMTFDEVPRPQMEVETSWSAPQAPPPAETPWEAPAASADESPFEPAAETAAPFGAPPPTEAAPEWQAPPPPLEMPSTSSAGMSGSVQLTDEQIDRIARRVVELMSDQVVKNIAWEVIPDLAEVVVRERIRQLESEA